jgi:hypothetical protein
VRHTENVLNWWSKVRTEKGERMKKWTLRPRTGI